MNSDQIEQIRQRLAAPHTTRCICGAMVNVTPENDKCWRCGDQMDDLVPAADARAMLTALDAANARIAALESVVHDLLDPVKWFYPYDHLQIIEDDRRECIYCECAGEHDPDCVWVKAKALLETTKPLP